MILKSVVLFGILVICNSDSVDRPRGVSLSMKSLYPVDKQFTCFDGSLTIPFDHINDDYCDCIGDGSDEPGTSACPNGSFYCTNLGHKPFFIPSSRVDDGICDCCDGSDEYNTQANCVNNCYELGQAAREEEARKTAIIKEGTKIKTELSLKGKQLKREKQLRILELMKEQGEAEILKNEKESIKTKIEEKEKEALDVFKQLEEQRRKLYEQEEKAKNEKEALKTFSDLDANGDNSLDAAEISKSDLLDQNKDGFVSEEETKPILGSETQISFDNFLSIGWEYIKQMSIVQKMNDKDKLPEETSHEAPEELEDGKTYGEDEDDGEHLSEETETSSEEPEGTVEEELKQEYDEETSKIINEATAARTEYDNAVRNLRDIQREIKQIEEALGKDFGKEDEYAYMVGECYEYTDREYTYKLCPFDQISQRPKDGGIETRLGAWGNWVEDKYNLMFYGNGQSCWNGPQRQTHVKLTCSTQTEVISASEPSRCEYLLEFNTPAACSLKDAKENLIDQHDEL